MTNLRKAQKESQKQRILAAARQLFETELYGAVTIRRVAALAGLSNTPVYTYFEGKEDLWRAAMGTEPPVDSLLTRRAADLESRLRQLLRLKAEGTAPLSAWDEAWSAAETTLRAVNGEAPPPPPAPPPPVESEPVFGPTRLILIQDLLAAADQRGWAPWRFGEMTAVLTDVCMRLAHHRVGLTAPAEVYKGMIEAAAGVLIASTRGVVDLPYRYDPARPAAEDAVVPVPATAAPGDPPATG